MLSKEDNDLLNQVEPGSPGNTYLKHFWMPVIRSEVLEADGMPEKIEVLGEKYIAFRDTAGNVGFMDEACPHRGISLSLGRNEGNGLTCIFHGWKFNVKGECVATPTESNKDFCKKVRVRSYPAREAGGAVWVYLAPGEPARFPDLPFLHAKPENTKCRRAMMRSNWSQSVEQFLDTGHVGFLHRNYTTMAGAPESIANAVGEMPYYDIEATAYGYRVYAQRDMPDNMKSLRVGEFIFPLGAMIATTENEVAMMPMVTPINNSACMFWNFLWGTKEQIAQGGVAPMPGDPNDWAGDLLDRSKPNFGQDRDAMKKGNWSGFYYLPIEDVATGESMPILDRTKEYLATVDVAMIRFRKDVLKDLRAVRDGTWQGRGDLSGINYKAMRAHALMLRADQDMYQYVNDLNARRIAAMENTSMAAE